MLKWLMNLFVQRADKTTRKATKVFSKMQKNVDKSIESTNRSLDQVSKAKISVIEAERRLEDDLRYNQGLLNKIHSFSKVDAE